MGPQKGKALRFIAYFTGCTCLALSMLSCAKAPGSQAQTEETIRQQQAAWEEAIGARQLDATVSYYADGAVLLPSNAPIARTKEEIRESWRQLFASVPAGATMSAVTTKAEVASSGDLAYTVGTYAYANPAIDKGKFVSIWKKQPDGSWKAVIDIFNSDMPIPPPAE